MPLAAWLFRWHFRHSKHSQDEVRRGGLVYHVNIPEERRVMKVGVILAGLWKPFSYLVCGMVMLTFLGAITTSIHGFSKEPGCFEQRGALRNLQRPLSASSIM